MLAYLIHPWSRALALGLGILFLAGCPETEFGQQDLPNVADGSSSPEASGCGPVGQQGCCAGSVLVWCDDGELRETNCAGMPSCGWNAATGGYDCGTDGGGDPTGSLPWACEGWTAPPLEDVVGDGYHEDLLDVPLQQSELAENLVDIHDVFEAAGEDYFDSWTQELPPADEYGDETKEDLQPEVVLPPDGACTNPSDLAVIDPQPAQVRASAIDCGIGCLGEAEVPPCTTYCLTVNPGLSAACANCYAAAVQCMFDNCLAECLADPDGGACSQCQQSAGCVEAFLSCSGLEAEAWLGEGESCEPDCAGKQCGADGCGDSCGVCTAGKLCQNGLCINAEGDCPKAVIKCTEGEAVIPQTILHLYGDDSYAANGTIQKYEWVAEQPAGSQSVFVPSHTFPNPTFETNVAGVYTFQLTVYDQTNSPSCIPAEYEVVVIPDEAIHIELLWHTPNDPDETDTGPEAGSDLDLHFLHPWAAGPDIDGDGQPDGWFDIPFDCFWFNAHPNWGSYDPAINDDPGLDRDDTDGAGPENTNLDIPENVHYRVGVHYWNDHGYGAAFATVRVYIYAQLVFELPDVMLADSDMWEVCTIEWPAGKVEIITDEDGQFKITPEYHNPYFFQ